MPKPQIPAGGVRARAYTIPTDRPEADDICGQNAMGIAGIYEGLRCAVRNPGQSGLAACAISAIDLALWDLKSRFLELNEAGCAAVKMKIGSNPEQDPKRAGASRRLEI